MIDFFGKKGMLMMIKLKDITPIDLYIYSLALELKQPFTAEQLMQTMHDEEREWSLDAVKYRCKKYRKQKMFKQSGIFRNVKYQCLLSWKDIENTIYVYSPPINVKNSSLFCGL